MFFTENCLRIEEFAEKKKGKSMSDKRTVSLVGAGKLGSLIIERLLALGAIVRVLARDPKKVAARHQNVELVQFDVVTATEEETTSALKGSYSVISSLQVENKHLCFL